MRAETTVTLWIWGQAPTPACGTVVVMDDTSLN
jgi:hypothetical protein